jgi:CMP-N-acetylneuraminic acid synthetase
MKNKNKNLLIIILARKGSKRLKNKNLRILGNKSLIKNTILFAKRIKRKKDIIVSTDSNKIQNIAKNLNVLSPWVRPKKFSHDKATSESSAIHALNWYEKNKEPVKNVLLLQPTTPIRNLKLFNQAISFFEKNSKYPLVSVNRYNKKIKNLVLIKNNFASFFKRNEKKENIYEINGSMYIISSKSLKRTKSFTQKKFTPFLLNRFSECIDIDNKRDLNIANIFLKYKNV